MAWSGQDSGINTMRKFLLAMAAAGILGRGVQAQGLPDQLNFLNSNLEGIRLFGLSAFTTYSNYDYPQSRAGLAANWRLNFGASGTIGWQRVHGRTGISARYTASYYANARNTELNNFNHSVQLNLTRLFLRKWMLTVSANAQEINLAQYLFEPTT